jgi:hypothetical protein
MWFLYEIKFGDKNGGFYNTGTCSLRSRPFIRAPAASMHVSWRPVAAKAPHEPHDIWSLAGVTKPGTDVMIF